MVDVQPQNQLGEGWIALAKNLKINGNAKTGVSDEQLARYVTFAGSTLNWPNDGDLRPLEANLKALRGLEV